MGQHFYSFSRTLPRAVCMVALGTGLAGCGDPASTGQASGLEQQDPSAPVIGRQPQTTTVSRNNALSELLRREGAQLLSNLPPDRDVLMTHGVTALELSSLLPDVSYSAEFVFENDKQRLASVTIGSSGAPERVNPTGGEPAVQADSFAARLEIADARERQDLIDDVQLSPESLRVFETQLAKQPVSSADDELQQALMQRLDLSDDVGAKLVVLNALQSSNSRIVEMALDSIDTWSDQSVVPWLKAAQSQPDPALAERISRAIEDFSQITVVPSGPGIRDVDVGALFDQAERRRASLQDRAQRKENGQ